jgi:hypothetical protein
MLAYNMASGAKKKTVLIPGTISINCCSRVPLEAEQLAWLVAEHLWMLRDVMRKWGFYDVGRNLAIGSPSPAGSIVQNDGGDEWYVVTITSPFQIGRISQSTPLGQRIASSVEITLGGKLEGRRPEGIPYTDRPEMPYAIDKLLPSDDVPAVGGSVDVQKGESSIASHSVVKMAHPLNPNVQVTVRAARPGDPVFSPPCIYGRAIPITGRPVEESVIELETRTIKT